MQQIKRIWLNGIFLVILQQKLLNELHTTNDLN